MRLAHISDLHVLALENVSFTRFFNKRLTGYANIRFKRGHIHRPAHLRAVAEEISRAKVDHVAVTGDITNLALESEFAAARSILETALNLTPDAVTIVPGNHDVYTRGARSSRRFEKYFTEYMTSDLPDLAVDCGVGRFPVVKLRGPIAVIGLSSAVPRPPFVASGTLGKAQLLAVSRVLEHPEVKKRTPVVLVHHPTHNPPSRLKTLVEGLTDADALIEHFARIRHGVVLHGHLHRRQEKSHGAVRAIGATSASLEHEDGAKMAGFNLYTFDDATGELTRVEAHILDQAQGTFAVSKVPLVA